MPKRSLRQQLLAQRRALGQDEWCASSRLAQLNVLTLQEYDQASSIGLYAPAHNETDTALIFKNACLAGKRVLYPAVCGADMVLRQVERLDCLSRGCFGILEPGPTGIDHQAEHVDLIMVPGVAFDQSGHRVGYGKGFYDRFLQHPDRSTFLVGLCHDFQLIEGALPADRHDIRMDVIVTNKRIIRCGSNRSQTVGPDSHRGG